jgi:hypothetical protein
MHSRTRSLAGLAFVLVAGACQDPAESGLSAPGAPVAIETPAPPGSNTPSLVVGRDGSAFLSWTERRADSSVAVRIAVRRGGVWDSARTIAERRPFFVNWADFPTVAVLRNGSLAAHWLEREATGKYAYGVRVVRSDDSARTWSAPITPHTDGLAAEHGFVTLWPEGEDGLGLAWLDGRKSAMPDSAKEMTVRTAVVGSDGALHHDAVLDARSCDCCQVVSAATRTGHVVAYRDRSPDEIRDIVVVRRMGDTWSAPVTVHGDNWRIKGCPVNGPAIAARGDTVTVAWFTAAQDTARVLVARSVDGGATFDAPVRVDDGDPIGRVALVLNDAGGAVVGWMERVSKETSDVRVRTIANGRRSAAQTVTSTSPARQSGFPRMVVAGDTLLVAWTAVTPALQVRMALLPLNTNSKR